MTPEKPLRFGEFIALLALLMATAAFSTDAMLPSMGAIGNELSPEAPEAVALVLTLFLLGMGVGTLFAGPLSDSFGRKRVMLGGIAIYMAAAAVAASAPTMEVLLVARAIQGLGAAAPRVVSQALVRDLYSGRMMARVISFGFTVFSLVPAVAPLIGAWIAGVFDWRGVFWSFLVFGTISALWLGLRQPETLPASQRRAFNSEGLWRAMREVLGHPRVRLYLLALTFVYITLFVWLGQVAMVFDVSFDRAAVFPMYFSLVALLAAPSSLMNAKLVMQFGMRQMAWSAIFVLLGISTVVLVVFAGTPGPWAFWLFLGYMIVQFSAMGFLLGNINALALEPMGHVAGMAASLVNGLATVLAALLVMPLTAVFDGTPVPMAATVLISTILNATAMRRARHYH
ncbi:MAG: multidrug effflux MFS transporter [Rhodobacter sp.]|nr:multidrug effflux MFS transporter [Paracoccaceae bacterium]MCC0075332.1 multidrug effflux MFS transporter [Rhodobacter sp.]